MIVRADRGGVVEVSAGHEYVGCTYGSVVSSAADVLEMSVMRGMSGVGGVRNVYVFGSGWCSR